MYSHSTYRHTRQGIDELDLDDPSLHKATGTDRESPLL